MVQGYKFNVFYPDLIDKKTAPEYSVEPDPEADQFGSTCILRFHAGPPYEVHTYNAFLFAKSMNSLRPFRLRCPECCISLACRAGYMVAPVVLLLHHQHLIPVCLLDAGSDLPHPEQGVGVQPQEGLQMCV